MNPPREVKRVARGLLNQLKQLLVIQWWQKSATRTQFKLTFEDIGL